MCNKAQYMYQGDKLLLQYYDGIANLFNDWQIGAPPTLQTLGDAITVYGDDFKEDLYLVTVAPKQVQGSRVVFFEGDPVERTNFMDFLDALSDILDGQGVGSPGQENKPPAAPPKDNKVLGMELSTFMLVLALAILAILVVIMIVR